MASSRPDGVRDEGSSRTFVVPQAFNETNRRPRVGLSSYRVLRPPPRAVGVYEFRIMTDPGEYPLSCSELYCAP